MVRAWHDGQASWPPVMNLALLAGPDAIMEVKEQQHEEAV
jgi:hypothetical protein